VSRQPVERRVIEEFHAGGYTVLRGFESPEQLSRLRQELVNAAAGAGTSWTPDEDVHPGFDVWVGGAEKVSDLAFDLSRSERYVGLAEALLGGPAVPLRSSYAAALPGSPDPSPWHLDAARYAPHFGTLPALAVCLPLHPVGPDAGGPRFLPRSSSTGGGEEQTVVPGVPPADTPGMVVAAGPGDAIVWHSFTPHRIDGNAREAAAEMAVFTYRFSPYRQRFGNPLAMAHDERGERV
jgi:hypothetical protein